VIVRQRIRGGIARERRIDGRQLRPDLAGPSVHEGLIGSHRLWEYAVLVTDVSYSPESIGQLCRDRADAENAFDELKNPWGLGDFTTQDINRCRTVARACALVYKWWSWYCRAANPAGPIEGAGFHSAWGGRRGQPFHVNGRESAEQGRQDCFLAPLACPCHRASMRSAHLLTKENR
jgi:hypothetical protein